MKRESILTRVIALVVVVGLGTTLTKTVSAASGCLKRPAPRCLYLSCGSIPGGGCEKWCAKDYKQGFGECVQGLSEEECTEAWVQSLEIWYYAGECSDGNCELGARQTGYFSGLLSSDISPCGGY